MTNAEKIVAAKNVIDFCRAPLGWMSGPDRRMVIIEGFEAAVVELEKSLFFNDYYYEALGPANDEIQAMAEEAWEGREK